jgi:hypothetical protein
LVDLAEIQAAYYMVAATGVLVAAIYYVMTLRTTQRNMKQTLETRQADILHRHAQINASKDFMEAWADVVTQQNFLTYEEWRQNYGPYKSPPVAYSNLIMVVQYYEILAGLLREKLVTMEMIRSIWQPIHLVLVWERVEPVIKGWREVYHDDSMYRNFEWLFNRFMELNPESSLILSVLREQRIKMHDRPGQPP